jgi:hypothetical protein
MTNRIEYSGFAIIPVILLFGYFLSNIGLRLPLLIPIGFLLLIGYVLGKFRLYYNSIILLFSLFFIWGTFLLPRSNAVIKVEVYMSFIIALSIIAMVDDEYGVTIKGDDIRKSETIEDLFNII